MTTFLDFQYSDQLMIILLMLGCIGFGIILHVAWMWDTKPKVDIKDLWRAIGARERAQFVVDLCKSHGPLVCGTLKNLKKCIGGKE